ncbi:hypothetical protein [Photobacterium leiognathi]|nr:hypothetical protein [Photobacterium leiognathi]
MPTNVCQIANGDATSSSEVSSNVEAKLVPILTIGFISLFIFAALFDMSSFTAFIQTSFESAANTFGQSWQ